MYAYLFLKISTRFPLQKSSFDISNCKIQTLIYYVPNDKYYVSNDKYYVPNDKYYVSNDNTCNKMCGVLL